MSNQNHSLFNAGAGAQGGEFLTRGNSASVHVSATTWGGQAVQIQIYNDASSAWEIMAGAQFTENTANVIAPGNSQRLRAVTTGAGGTMAGVNVFFCAHQG
jgi:hypothetical protein